MEGWAWRCHGGKCMLGVQGVRILQRRREDLSRFEAAGTMEGLHVVRCWPWHHRGVTWDEGRRRVWDGGRHWAGGEGVGAALCKHHLLKSGGEMAGMLKISVWNRWAIQSRERSGWEGQWAVNSKQMNKPWNGVKTSWLLGFSFWDMKGQLCTCASVCVCWACLFDLICKSAKELPIFKSSSSCSHIFTNMKYLHKHNTLSECTHVTKTDDLLWYNLQYRTMYQSFCCYQLNMNSI